MHKRVGSLVISVFLINLFLIVVMTKQAHAYIDIGSASYLIQILVATMVASLLAIKVFWQKLLDKANRIFYSVKRFIPGSK